MRASWRPIKNASPRRTWGAYAVASDLVVLVVAGWVTVMEAAMLPTIVFVAMNGAITWKFALATDQSRWKHPDPLTLLWIVAVTFGVFLWPFIWQIAESQATSGALNLVVLLGSRAALALRRNPARRAI